MPPLPQAHPPQKPQEAPRMVVKEAEVISLLPPPAATMAEIHYGGPKLLETVQKGDRFTL